MSGLVVHAIEPAATASLETSAARRMFSASAVGQPDVMEILIVLDEVDPPVGRVSVQLPVGDDSTPRQFPFAGWLELLRVLYEVAGHAGVRTQ